MLKLCVKIWAVANGMVFAVFGVFLLRQGLGAGLFSLLYSALFSLPALLVLYTLLRFLLFAQGSVWFSWAVLLGGTGLASYAAYALFRLTARDLSELDFLLPLSFVCGYSSVLLFSYPLHHWFEKFYYSRYENS